MGVPVIQNTQTASNTGASSGSVTITKPTGLAVGDLMVAFIAYWAGGATRTITTPSGWTSVQKADGTDGGMAIFTKVANSGDVSASDFTFSISASGDCIAGTLHRIDGYSSQGSSEQDSTGTPASASLSYTTAITPTVLNNLILIGWAGCDATWTGTPSAGSYTTTPSKTITEVSDVGVKSGDHGLCLAVAKIENTGNTDQITNRGVTFNDTITGQGTGMIFVIEGSVDGLGTTALLLADADFFAPTASSGTSGNADFAIGDADFFTQSGNATTRSVWTNETKPSDATWTNESKP